MTLLSKVAWLGAGALVLHGATAGTDRKLVQTNQAKGNYLYVWTGDYDAKHHDFLAVFDFNRNSSTYGKFLHREFVDTYGNEPHHGQVDAYGRTFGGAGILSFLWPLKAKNPNQPQLYFFDLTDPQHPKYTPGNNEKSVSTAKTTPIFKFGTQPTSILSLLPSGLTSPANILNTDLVSQLDASHITNYAQAAGYAAGLPTGAADEFYPLADGTFLVSSLCTRGGQAFGQQLAHIDHDGTILGLYPAIQPYNPYATTAAELETVENIATHGITARPDLDLLSTTNFIEAASVLKVTQPVYQGLRRLNTVNLWRLSTFEIIYTWKFEADSAQLTNYFIPGNELGLILTVGVHANKIYWLNPDIQHLAASGDIDNPEWAPSQGVALDLTQEYPGAEPHYLRITKNGKQAFLSLCANNRILQLDLTNPQAISIISSVSIPNSNPHYIDIFPSDDGSNDHRFVMVGYFLDFQDFGIIHQGGDKIVRVFRFNETNFWPDPKWPNLDFKTLFPDTGVATPHGTAFWYNPGNGFKLYYE